MENDPKDDHAHGDHSYAPRHSAQSVILSTLAVMLISLLQVLQRKPVVETPIAARRGHGKGSTG
jgi:hypothetical protein